MAAFAAPPAAASPAPAASTPASAPASTPAPSAATASAPAVSEPGSGNFDVDALFANVPPPAADGEAPLSEIGDPDIEVEPEEVGEAVIEATEEETQPAAAADPNAPALPDGVKVRSVNGQKQWMVDPKLGEATFAKAKILQDAEDIIGEPLTVESAKFLQDGVINWETMRNKTLSSNPAHQGEIIDGIGNLIREAAKNGEIGDGNRTLTGIISTTIDRGLADPGTAPHIINKLISDSRVSRALVDSLYTKALTMPVDEKAPDSHLHAWRAAAWIDKLVHGSTPRKEGELAYLRGAGAKSLPKYETDAKTPPTQPPVQSRPQGNPQQEAAFKTWGSELKGVVSTKALIQPIDEVLKAAFSDEVRKQFPENIEHFRDRLTNKVLLKLDRKTNDSLNKAITTIEERAKMATSPAVRDQLKTEAIKLYTTRAANALREVKGPIITEFSKLVKVQSDAGAARAAASTKAGQQTRPNQGPSASQQTSPPPAQSRFHSRADSDKFGDRLFAQK